mmetsp:Transcript_25398/g.73252  ORF Transcript_25398/g.73252 Transcript_25398/m.73252 type:complete len:257 (-) Transcript_25398:2535-3305(-)
MAGISSAYMGQPSSTRASEHVRFTTPFRSCSVMESGTTWPFASMLCMASPTSVLRSISLSSSWAQSTAWVLGCAPASMGAKTEVPLWGRPRTTVTEGIIFCFTLAHAASTSWPSTPAAEASAGSTVSRPARLQGMRTRPLSFLSMASCISGAKNASIFISISNSSRPSPVDATRSSASARVKSRSTGLELQGTRYSRNSTCFRLWGKSLMTKFWTPRAMSRKISARTSGQAMDASTGLPLSRACLTLLASFSSELA